MVKVRLPAVTWARIAIPYFNFSKKILAKLGLLFQWEKFAKFG